MKQQVLVIHGGDTFSSKESYLDFLRNNPINFEKMTRLGWKENLRTDLGEKFEVILPQMPNKTDGRYEEWAMTFEKLFPFLQDGIILVGHSMGGTFIAKYLAENNFPRKIKATYLIAAPFGDNLPEYELLSFLPPSKMQQFQNQAGKITVYHSQDDPLVPPADGEKYKDALNAELVTLNDRGHFGQEHFPKLAESIKSL